MKTYRFLTVILMIALSFNFVSCSDDEDKKEVLDIPEIASPLPLETGTFKYSKLYNFTFEEWTVEGYGSSGEIYISDDYTVVTHTRFVYGGPSESTFDDGRKSGQSVFCNDDAFEHYFAKTTKGEKVIVWHRPNDGAKVFYFI